MSKFAKWPAFTLAELLVALFILGVIATFSIPKVITAQQDGRYKAMGKEVAAMIASAYSVYQLDNSASGATGSQTLTAYMNYVSTTTNTIDSLYGWTTASCAVASGNVCLKMHSGGVLLAPVISFASTNSTNAIYFYFDPDGTSSATTNSPSKSIAFFLYANGRITSYSNMATGTTTSFGVESSCSTCDPPWFSWN